MTSNITPALANNDLARVQPPSRISAVLRPALVLFLGLSIATGIAYPLLTTGIAQGLFPTQANGSLIARDGKVLGSRLIGQSFTAPQYFWGRPSATAPAPYNASASSGSNLGPRNPDLQAAVQARVSALQSADPDNKALIPADLVSASGSGLDPHISPAAAQYQLRRVAQARGLPQANVSELINAHTTRPFLPVLGEPVVNVLTLNLALDDLQHNTQNQAISR